MQNRKSTQKSESNLWIVTYADNKQSLFHICYELYLDKSQLDVAANALSIVISALLLGSFDSLYAVSEENESFIRIGWRENTLSDNHSTLLLIYKFLDSYATISPVHKKEASAIKEFLLNESALPF